MYVSVFPIQKSQMTQSSLPCYNNHVCVKYVPYILENSSETPSIWTDIPYSLQHYYEMDRKLSFSDSIVAVNLNSHQAKLPFPA